MAGRTDTERREYLREVRMASMVCLPYKEPRFMWLEEQPEAIMSFSRVHLLGVSELDELQRFAYFAQGKHTWSVDTAKPIKWGLKGRKIDDGKSLRNAQQQQEFLDATATPAADALDIIKHNIAVLKKICA